MLRSESLSKGPPLRPVRQPRPHPRHHPRDPTGPPPPRRPPPTQAAQSGAGRRPPPERNDGTRPLNGRTSNHQYKRSLGPRPSDTPRPFQIRKPCQTIKPQTQPSANHQNSDTENQLIERRKPLIVRRALGSRFLVLGGLRRQPEPRPRRWSAFIPCAVLGNHRATSQGQPSGQKGCAGKTHSERHSFPRRWLACNDHV